jgi:hypothetical protein
MSDIEGLAAEMALSSSVDIKFVYASQKLKITC